MTRAREAGMTLIEVVVTLLIVTGGVLVTLASFTDFSNAAHTSQVRAVLTSVAQQHIERLRPLPYAQVGLSAPVPTDAGVRAPRTGAAAGEPLVMGGAVSPGGDHFDVQGITGRVYRYVTWRPQPCPKLTEAVRVELAGMLGQTTSAITSVVPDLCPSTARTKRITVVAVPDTARGSDAPVRLSTVISDAASATPVLSYVGLQVQPLVQALAGAGAGAGAGAPAPTVTQQAFQLHDTRCDAPARVAPTDHPTRSTAELGATCAAGSDGRPDLMTTAPVPGELGDPLPDASTDVTRGAAGGLVLMRDDRAGSCADPVTAAYLPGEAETRRYALHSWATPPSTAPAETAASNGRAVLSLWTQTADRISHPGRLCVQLRRMSTGAVLGSADFSLTAWPVERTELSIGFDLAHVVLPAGERLVVTVRVPKNSGTDIAVAYDHPAHQSRLTITSAIGKEFR